MELNESSTLLIYAVPMMVIWGVYAWSRARRNRRSLSVLEESVVAGLTEPASLHPVINEAMCIGCGSCVDACPEKSVLGLIAGKAHLITPSACIGHGACAKACPTHSIALVFGTEKRGVDIPLVTPHFESNVPGIFIAGELGGMGLIGNAIEQGKQAMGAIAALDGMGKGKPLDVAIIGAGPAGFSAALAAREKGLSYIVIEQDSFGGTVSHYPRGKVVMTRTVQLPLVGKVKFGEISKERLLEFWQKVRDEYRLNIHYNERMEALTPVGEGFQVNTSQGSYSARAVLLAIGRRGTPRQLGVPGEEQCKVVYRLIDPEQYRGQHVLVVGGGDSALEAAWSIAEQPGTTVTISYRSEAFARAKTKNRDRVQQMQAASQLQVMLGSQVLAITPEAVRLKWQGEESQLVNHAVIICAGGVLPTPFLKSIGIEVQTKYGEA